MSQIKIPANSMSPSAYLAIAAGSYTFRNRFSPSDGPVFYSGYLSIASNEVDAIKDPVVVKHKDGDVILSPFQAVVGLAPYNARYRRLESWPTSLDEFDQLSPVSPELVDAEWTAALLLAAGLDPWDIQNDADPGATRYTSHFHPVFSVVGMGWTGVLKNMLSHPNVPGIEEIAQLPYKDPSNRTQTIRGEVLARGYPEVLEVMLSHGMKLPEDESTLVGELGEASEESVKILSERGVLASLSASSIKKVQSAWSARTKSRGLTPQELATMASFLLPPTATDLQKVSASAAQIDGILSVQWNCRKHSNQVLSIGVDELNTQAPSKSQHRGQWSVLGAYAMAELRRTNIISHYGVPGWAIGPLIYGEYVKEKGWQYADPSSPPYKGSLKPAIEVEWRPGITMAAPVLLSVLGRAPENRSISEDPIQDLCQACGIDDTSRWVRDNANAMADFTSAIMRPAARAQHAVFSMVWAKVLESEYAKSVLDGMSEQNRANLMLAITGNFNSTDVWPALSSNVSPAINRFNAISGALFPDLCNPASRGKTAYLRLAQNGQGNSPLAQAILTHSLATAKAEGALEIITSAAPYLSNKTPGIKVVKMWMAAKKDQDEYAASISKIKSVILQEMANESRSRLAPSDNRPKI